MTALPPEPGPGSVPAGGPEPSRRLPQTLGGTIFLVIIAMTGVGLTFVVAGPWRTGLSWIGAGLLIGAASRVVLSDRRAGMLRVRRRWSDVLMLVVAGVALLVLAQFDPDQTL